MFCSKGPRRAGGDITSGLLDLCPIHARRKKLTHTHAQHSHRHHSNSRAQDINAHKEHRDMPLPLIFAEMRLRNRRWRKMEVGLQAERVHDGPLFKNLMVREEVESGSEDPDVCDGCGGGQ